MFWGKKKQKQKVFSGFPGDCSPDQLVALQNFTQYVRQNKNIDPNQYNEAYLLRFLRARKFDVTKTKLMWDNYIKWRVKNNIDICFKFKFPELPQLRKMYPHGYHKVDKQFRPIYIQRVGSIDVQKIFKVMSTENLLNYYALLYETLLKSIFDGCSQAKLKATGNNQRVGQSLTILDLKHVKLGSASKAYDFVKPVSAMAQDNYPQILGNMFIINAPMLFTGIWAIVKMWIDDKTKEKIKILGSSYKKQLLQLQFRLKIQIDPQNLPDFLQGGKCKCQGGCQLDRNIGPWNPEGKQMLRFALGQQQQQIKLESKQQQKVQVKKEQIQQQVKNVQIIQTDIQLAKEEKTSISIEQKQQAEQNSQQQKAVMFCVNAGLAAQQVKYSSQNQKNQSIKDTIEEKTQAQVEKPQAQVEKTEQKQQQKVENKQQLTTANKQQEKTEITQESKQEKDQVKQQEVSGLPQQHQSKVPQQQSKPQQGTN